MQALPPLRPLNPFEIPVPMDSADFCGLVGFRAAVHRMQHQHLELVDHHHVRRSLESRFSEKAVCENDDLLHDCSQIGEIVPKHVDQQGLVCGTVESHLVHLRVRDRLLAVEDLDQIAGKSHVHVHGTDLALDGPVAGRTRHAQGGDEHALVVSLAQSNQTCYHTGNPFDKRVP